MISYKRFKVKDSVILHTKLIKENQIEVFTESLNKNEISLLSSIQSVQRKKEFVTIRLLLNSYFNRKTELIYENKKPILTNSKYISISHKDQELIIGINNYQPIGVDIEKISEKLIKIKHKFCNKKELLSLIDDESIETLTSYWCAKEATFKCLAEQTNVFLNDIQITFESKEKGLSENNNSEYQLDFLKINEHYILCHAQKQS